MMAASIKDSDDVLDLLLNKGADVNMKSGSVGLEIGETHSG